VRALVGRIEASLEDAPGSDSQRWRDEGYWLTPLLAVLLLLWFRPGWVIRWA
jgi:Ca-activated chloride channel family protein